MPTGLKTTEVNSSQVKNRACEGSKATRAAYGSHNVSVHRLCVCKAASTFPCFSSNVCDINRVSRNTIACVSSRLQSDAATAWLLPRSFKSHWPKKVFIVDARSRFISLEGSERPAIVAGVSNRLRITEAKWKQRDLPQLLPMYISSIKSVVLPNPTTKQGRCVHTLTAERRKHMKHIRWFYRTYGTRRGMKTREQINP